MTFAVYPQDLEAEAGLTIVVINAEGLAPRLSRCGTNAVEWKFRRIQKKLKRP